MSATLRILGCCPIQTCRFSEKVLIMVSFVLPGSKVCDFQIFCVISDILYLNKKLQNTVKPTFQALILERVTIVNILPSEIAKTFLISGVHRNLFMSFLLEPTVVNNTKTFVMSFLCSCE